MSEFPPCLLYFKTSLFSRVLSLDLAGCKSVSSLVQNKLRASMVSGREAADEGVGAYIYCLLQPVFNSDIRLGFDTQKKNHMCFLRLLNGTLGFKSALLLFVNLK